MFKYLFLFVFTLVPVTLSAEVQTAPKPDPEKATFRARCSNGGGSATCIWVENGKSVMISNNHVFSELDPVTNRYPLAPYPLGVLVSQVEDRKEVGIGEAVGGDPDADVAVIVIPKVLPFVRMARVDEKVGNKVWHRGTTSKFTGGLVLECPQQFVEKYGQFASNLASIPGDSGAGVVNGSGELVAINCGRFAMEITSPQRGTPVSHIRGVVKKVVGKTFPKLATELKD